MSNIKERLLKEVEIRTTVTVEGVSYDPKIFEADLENGEVASTVHNLFDFCWDDTVAYPIPVGARSANGIYIPFIKNAASPYEIKKEDGQLCLVQNGNVLLELHLSKPPAYFNKTTLDGTPMRTVLITTADGNHAYDCRSIVIAYSNECSLHEKGLDCLFCNINATKTRFGEKEGIRWKNPSQIAEAVKEAFQEGFNQLTITGGFIPERREVDYYIDVAEKLREVLDADVFNGTACIGAPVDLSVIEKYKEAGYRTIATNLECANKDFFQAICPGKVQDCGDHDHWIEALLYEVEVFGKGKVRSNIMSGIEPKEYFLETAEFLAEKGVIAVSAVPWRPNIGSKLEGHRTPSPEWHWDLQQKLFQILRKNGRTYEEIYNAGGGDSILLELYRIEDERLPVFETH
jgi:hypothetical protein